MGEWGNDQETVGGLEEAQIHRVDRAEAGRSLHCRTSGRASSPGRRTVDITVVTSTNLTPNHTDLLPEAVMSYITCGHLFGVPFVF